jgi:hypothetical protein
MIRFIIIFALFLCSCSAEWHLTRAILKDPTIIETDTIHDTIITQGQSASDSVRLPRLKPCSLNVNIPIDTNGVKGQIYVRGEWIRYEVECPGDTLYRTVPVEKVIYRTKEEPFWANLERIMYALAVLVGLLLLARYLPDRK